MAERFGMSRKASGFAHAVGVVHELALLAIERQQSDLGFPPAALVLAQRHDAGEIGFREPLSLLAQPCPGATQIGPPRLQLWCMDQRGGRAEADACPGSYDADVLRASGVQHTVQSVGSDGHFGRLPPVRLRA